MAIKKEVDLNGDPQTLSTSEIATELGLTITSNYPLSELWNGRQARKFKADMVSKYNPDLDKRTPDNLTTTFSDNNAALGEFFNYGGAAVVSGSFGYFGLGNPQVYLIHDHKIVNQLSGLEYRPELISVDLNNRDHSTDFDGDKSTISPNALGRIDRNSNTVVEATRIEVLSTQSYDVIGNLNRTQLNVQGTRYYSTTQVQSTNVFNLIGGTVPIYFVDDNDTYTGSYNATIISTSACYIDVAFSSSTTGTIIIGIPDGHFGANGLSVENTSIESNSLVPIQNGVTIPGVNPLFANSGDFNAILYGSPAPGNINNRYFIWSFYDTLDSNNLLKIEDYSNDSSYFRGIFTVPIDESNTSNPTKIAQDGSIDPIRFDDDTRELEIWYLPNILTTFTPADFNTFYCEVEIYDVAADTVIKTFTAQRVPNTIPSGTGNDANYFSVSKDGGTDEIYIADRDSGAIRYPSRLRFTFSVGQLDKIYQIRQRTTRTWGGSWTASQDWSQTSLNGSGLNSRTIALIYV